MNDKANNSATWHLQRRSGSHRILMFVMVACAPILFPLAYAQKPTTGTQASAPQPLAAIPQVTFTCPSSVTVGGMFFCTMSVSSGGFNQWTLYVAGTNKVVGTANNSGSSHGSE